MEEVNMYADTEAQEAMTAETQQPETTEPTEKTAKKESAFKQYFTARRIAYIATFTAMSFALRFLEIMILPAVPFLKLDFSDVFVLICAYALGPLAGMTTGILKEALWGFFSTTAFVGELANIIVMTPFVLIPSVIYKKHKGIKWVAVWLSVACVVRTAWSFPANLLLTFPAFLGFNWELGMTFFMSVWPWVMLFNLIKSVILAVVVMLLYKSVSRLIGLINRKFDDRKQTAVSRLR